MNSSRFRSFMKTELDLIETNNEPLCITTVRKGEPQQMVIISKAQYDRVMSQLKYTHERCSISDFSESEYLNEINEPKHLGRKIPTKVTFDSTPKKGRCIDVFV